MTGALSSLARVGTDWPTVQAYAGRVTHPLADPAMAVLAARPRAAAALRVLGSDPFNQNRISHTKQREAPYLLQYSLTIKINHIR